ncbi:hypothetical protein SLEP1_g54657 [Rubroshorea leprosula]|uniref:Reverse transcriptase domain-containing protein n=1 Tax=Rubroshorea leprosula TaxID=152421 RepID=A0AAV5MDE1_9ROSI|nr:hypothetical protein SLEP1_g54657 [Rubroshorea leprosula]
MQEALGCHFTWTKKRNGRTVMRERLNRAVLNLSTMEEFSTAKLINLPRLCSDHHPILLNIQPNSAVRRPRGPPRFEVAWLTREDFGAVFENAWKSHNVTLARAIEETSKACFAWGKESFGDIFKQKRLLVARLTGIQNSSDYQYSVFLQKLEGELLTEYHRILHAEELFWCQKSRVEWINSGDRNTSFYHTSTIVQRNRNRITTLKIDDNWVDDDMQLRSHVRSFFQELFVAKQTNIMLNSYLNFQPQMEDSAHESLLKPASLDEVKQALFSMKGLKSPGPDGLQAIFFQKYWTTVSGTLLHFVNSALINGSFEPSLLQAHVALIPKGDAPDVIQKFRPITLLNVAYKVLSKVLVNRLRPYLQELIGPFQSSFLAGRSTIDNIVLTQEAVHSIRHRKGKKGAIILKIDLHKAFDSVSWGFLEKVLLDFNIPPTLVKLIMFCVNSVKLSVLWNGEPLPYFEPQRGLRQGDPLSPYLFIMVMEKLSRMILNRIHSKTWKPIQLSRGGLALSHLFFADDLMLFCEASHSQLSMVINCLKEFASYSGLEINLAKSKLFVSPNIQSAMARSLSISCGIPLTSNLGTYLGVPIIHGRNSAAQYKYIIEKMQLKLASWKQNTLSLAGRRILIQSVTSSIPAYTMQTVLLPHSTCDAIDKMNRNFLWGTKTGNSRPHLVSWEVVCRSKDQGGLGLRAARDNNRALVAKLGWRVLVGDEAPWCQVMRQKYFRTSTFLSAEASPRSSVTWRSIIHCKDVLEFGLQWRIGLGDSINFWKDYWTYSSPLCNFITAQVNEILSIPLSSTASVKDKIVWKYSDDGFFSIKSAFHQILQQKAPIPLQDQSWLWVWKLRCSERVRMFLWLLLCNRVLTNAVRFERHLASSLICPRCGGDPETPLHLLRDCPFATQVWTLLGLGDREFFQLPWQHWIKISSRKVTRVQHGEMSYDLFLSIIWQLWKCRNRFIFNGEHIPAAALCDKICDYAQDTYKAMVCNIFVSMREPRWICWYPLDPPFYKLNTDGSRIQDTGFASAGRVLRDQSGVFIQCYSVNIGLVSIFLAELWGCREGLILCKNKGLKHVVVEMDSLSAVQVINGQKEQDSLSAVLVFDIRRLRFEFDSIIIQHTPREANSAADFLAGIGHSLPIGTTVFDSPPPRLNAFLERDMLGFPSCTASRVESSAGSGFLLFNGQESCFGASPPMGSWWGWNLANLVHINSRLASRLLKKREAVGKAGYGLCGKPDFQVSKGALVPLMSFDSMGLKRIGRDENMIGSI